MTNQFLKGTSGGGGDGLTWNVVTGTSQAISAFNGYIANNVVLVTFTLPATCAVGERFKIVGKGIGKYKIAQNAGQSIVFGKLETTTGVGGSLDAEHEKDVIEILCTETDVEFQMIDSSGNFAVV